MSRIGDRPLPSTDLNVNLKVACSNPAAPAPAQPANGPKAVAGDQRAIRAGTDVLDVATIDLCEVVLPGDLAENGARSGTSGSAGGRRADAGVEGPLDRDFAENGATSGTSGSAGGRRADAGVLLEALPATDFADNGSTQSTSGSSGGGRPRPGAGAQAQAQPANA